MGKLNWAQIIITAIITGIVTVGTGLILSGLQGPEPKLVYSVAETIPFSGEKEVTAIYQVSISNEGNREVENVICSIQIPLGKITESRVLAAASMRYKSEVVGGALDFALELPLNPSERVQVLVLATGRGGLPRRPEVSLRAKGISGVEKALGGEGDSERERFITPLLMSFAGLFAAFASLLGMRKGKKLFGAAEAEAGVHTGDQRRLMLAYLCRVNGLAEEYQQYANQVSDVEYWFEADRLGLLATEAHDQTVKGKVKNVLEGLLNYAIIAEQSRAIVLFNLAKVSASEGNQGDAQKYLERAKRSYRGLVEKRLSMESLDVGVFRDRE